MPDEFVEKDEVWPVLDQDEVPCLEFSFAGFTKPELGNAKELRARWVFHRLELRFLKDLKPDIFTFIKVVTVDVQIQKKWQCYCN